MTRLACSHAPSCPSRNLRMKSKRANSSRYRSAASCRASIVKNAGGICGFSSGGVSARWEGAAGAAPAASRTLRASIAITPPSSGSSKLLLPLELEGLEERPSVISTTWSGEISGAAQHTSRPMRARRRSDTWLIYGRVGWMDVGVDSSIGIGGGWHGAPVDPNSIQQTHLLIT